MSASATRTGGGRGGDWPLTALVLLLWLLVVAAMLYGYRAAIGALALADPDDALRLVQVRDLLAGQPWRDFSQYRINPADGGGQLHWSRFIDAQIGALILLFQQFLPAVEAERWAAALYPPLLMLPLLMIFRRLLAHLGDRRFVAAGLIAAATTLSFVHYFVPLRIDHHNWQLLLSVAMLWLAMGPPTLRRGLAAALVIGVHLEISLEGLPYLLIFGALFAFDWLRDPAAAPRLQGFALGLGTVTPLWLLAWRGTEAVGGVYCDAFSRPYVAGAAVTGLLIAAALTQRRRFDHFAARAALLAAAGLAGGAVFAFAGPACLAGPFGALDPLVRRYWYEGIAEGQPLWEVSGATFAGFLAPSLAGLAALVWSLRRMRGAPQAKDWERLLLAASASFILSLLVLRATAAAHAYLVAGYAPVLLALFDRARALGSPLLRIPATAASVVALPLSVSALALAVMLPFEDDPADGMPTDCVTPAALRRLATVPPTTIFSGIDMAPAILVGTRHSVVATGHHRNHRAIHAVLAAFMGGEPTAERLVRASGATRVALCVNLPEHAVHAKYAPNGLAARLARGAPPPWLVAEPALSLGPLRVFRVLPPRAAAAAVSPARTAAPRR